MTWLTPQTIPIPQQSAYPTLAEFILAYTVYGDLVNASSKFLAVTPDPQYANPRAYLAAMVNVAINITRYSNVFAPQGWDAVKAGMNAAFNAFDVLLQLPVNAGDPNTVSVMQAWEDKTGSLYGGHAPIPANTGDGVNTATGQSAAPPGSIL